MAVYDNVKVKVFIHPGNPGIETGDEGTMARDIKDYIETLDSTNIKFYLYLIPNLTATEYLPWWLVGRNVLSAL